MKVTKTTVKKVKRKIVGGEKTKVTKRAKKVVVKFKKVKSFVAQYNCPSCHTQFTGAYVLSNTTRFVCECGQELIVIQKWIDTKK